MYKSKWKKFNKIFLIVLFSAVTEVWDFDTGENEIIEPVLPDKNYAYGMAIFAVDPYYCNI